jgi:hypothetical protein
MNNSEKVTVADRAWIGWSQLPAPTQASIRESLGALAGRPPMQWPSRGVERWWADDDLFALRVWVGPDDLLVFFRPEEGGHICLDNMALKETIERFTGRKS